MQAQDEAGNLILRAAQPVTFTVEGEGEILGTDNGDLNCHVPYVSHTMPLYRGRVSVLVHAHGPVKVTAVCEGLRAAEWTVLPLAQEAR